MARGHRSKSQKMMMITARRMFAPCSLRRAFCSESVPVPLPVETVPVNILQDGTDPVLKPYDEYPAWLPNVITNGKGFSELERKSKPTLQDEIRMLKLFNRRRIKNKNASD